MTKTTVKFRDEAVKSLYAVAGATEFAFEFARGYAVEAQKGAQARVAQLQKSIEGLTKDAAQTPKLVQTKVQRGQSAFEGRVAALPQEAAKLPTLVQSRALQTAAELSSTYTDLSDRGEKFVAAIRKDGLKAAAAVKKAPSRSTVVRRETALRAREESAAETAPKKAQKKTPAKKVSAKKTPAKKAAAKKAPAKKTAAKKAPANKAAVKKSATTEATASA